MNTVATPIETNTKEWLQPFLLAVPFTTIVASWFNFRVPAGRGGAGHRSRMGSSARPHCELAHEEGDAERLARGRFRRLILYYIIVNGSMELLITPGLLYLGWRAGKRRILIVAGAALFFAFRVWSYLAFVPNRLAFGELEGKGTPFTAAERQQAFVDLQLDDPRWILGLPIFAIFVLALHFSRVRQLSRV